VTNNIPTDGVRRAIEACRLVRGDAVRLLAGINEGGDTYVDRTNITADLDVTSKQAESFQSVIDRMDIALSELEVVDA
jgi:hypothetical protein